LWMRNPGCSCGLSNSVCSRLVVVINYRIIIVNTVQCDSIRIYLLPLHVSVSWPSSEGLISTCLGTITWFVKHTKSYLQLFGLKLINI
jgi:hypothetical protein